MISSQQVQDLMANKATVVDQDGTKVGKIEQIYLDDSTNEPEWATASTGMFGSSESFIPLRGATVDGEQIRVQYTKDMIKDAPRIDSGEHLAPAQAEELYRYYGLSSNGGTAGPDGVAQGTAGPTAGQDGVAPGTAGQGTAGAETGRQGTVGRDTSGPTTDDAMTRSEEQLDVGTENRETGRARLRKFVVTEDVHTTVPVSREEVRVVKEPINDANRDEALDGPALSDEEHEVTLHEEVPVVNKETKPVERVRMEKETTTDQAEVDEQVRKERIEAEGADDDGDRLR